MTYTVMNAGFLFATAVVVFFAHRRLLRRGITARWVGLVRTTVIVLLQTVVFDNLIIAAGIVDYAPSHLLGLTVGLVPIEDFAYTLAATTGLPAVWILLGPRHTQPQRELAAVPTSPDTKR